MTWDELFDNLLELEGHEVLIQVGARHDGAPHTAVLSAIGRFAAEPHTLSDERGRDTITLGLATGGGEMCGGLSLRQSDFEDARRADARHLEVSYSGMDLSIALRDQT